MTHVYNSSCNDASTNRGRPYNPAFMHPSDLGRLGVHAGDVVEISSRRAAILGIVEPDDTLLPGLVSMSFGFGDAPEWDSELRLIGSSTARLVSDDVDFDRYSGQPRMSNIPVDVRRYVGVPA